jgi:ATP-binding cassette, subfamily B, multidrug efflux pump
MFGFFERLLEPTALQPDAPPPHRLMAFYWHYARQIKGLVMALFLAGTMVALLDSTIPVFIGKVVALLTAARHGSLSQSSWREIALIGFVLLVVRPLAVMLQSLITNQAVNPGFTNLVRWQSHWHVVRQSWSFFQSDFAGRIANRVMQTGPSLRESVVSATNAIWYIVIYGSSAIWLLSSRDARLALPVLCWFTAYAIFLRIFVPRLRELSHRLSEMRSNLTGRVVDSYTNILTVKLFARPRDEDDFVQASVDAHTAAFRDQLRVLTLFGATLTLMNAALFVGTGAVAIWMWSEGRIAVGTVAMALPLVWQIVNISGWVAQNVTSIFENVGVVQDGMRSIAVPRQMPDHPGASTLAVRTGAVRFADVHFGYGSSRGVLRGIDLAIASGERIGLVGPSGAGKSTMVNLLLRFFDVEHGQILIDGQDIAAVTQESLRANIAMVTQDTSLLHRSIRDNIRYGKPDASEREIREAARKAHALEFIENLEDWQGRYGFDAHVGERGVKLSGGQRQRVALARVILRNAPILVLDEATSALDSEVEAAIQEQLDSLMEGRTVIAIAHRLSTIARMDRLVVMDGGQIVEMGNHAELLRHKGVYARLWRRQSGRFEAQFVHRMPELSVS